LRLEKGKRNSMTIDPIKNRSRAKCVGGKSDKAYRMPTNDEAQKMMVTLMDPISKSCFINRRTIIDLFYFNSEDTRDLISTSLIESIPSPDTLNDRQLAGLFHG
jgi:hypothetical protein